jgi:hypothetical protein
MVTMRCAGCSVRNALLFASTTFKTGLRCPDGNRTWDGLVFAVASRVEEFEVGYHGQRRYRCQACGRPWPNDDAVTAAVLRTQGSSRADSAVLA